MRGYIAFVKKEFIEHLRTYKLLVLMGVFLILGMMNPLIAKLTPEVLKLLPMEGIQITVPDPTAIDSYMQFFKNGTSIGLVVLVLVFCGMLVNELTKGTLINILTKGLTRSAVIMAKITASILLWSGALGISVLTTYLYTIYLFPTGDIYHLPLSIFCLWLFGVFLLSVLMFTSTLCKSIYGSLLGTGGVVVLLNLMGLIPNSTKYNPITLATTNLSMLAKDYQTSDPIYAILIAAALILLLTTLSCTIFRKKRI